MKKTHLLILLLIATSIARAQNKKEQIETLNFQLDSIKQLSISVQKTFNQKLAFKNTEITELKVQIIGLNAEKEGLGSRLNRTAIRVDSLRRLLDYQTKRVDTLSLQIIEQTATINSLKSSTVVGEPDWLLVERSIIAAQKDTRTAVEWLNTVVKPQDRAKFQGYFTPDCFAYLNDVTEFYWGYPGSIEQEELQSKWESLFDLSYSNFGHAFENGNCGWASLKLQKIDYLGVFNDGDWFKLTITGGCQEGDDSQTILRVVKLINDKGSFKIANFVALSDN